METAAALSMSVIKSIAKSAVKSWARWVCRMLFRIRIVGDAEAFKASRLLIIANHESFLDGLILGLFLPVEPVFVVHTSVIGNPLFRIGLKFVRHLAVDPMHPMAMKKVVKLLESGQPVMVFPEGRITVTGSLMKVYDGPAFAAAHTGATIVPVRLEGPARSYFSRLTGQHPRQLFPRITLSIQPATRISVAHGDNARLRRRAAGARMREIMEEMLFASHSYQTIFTAFVDALSIHGRRTRVAEDMQQIEYSYGQLLRMSLALGRLCSRFTREQEQVGVLLPNLASTVALVLGLSGMGRIPAMLNYTAGTEGLQSACVAARIRIILTSRKFVETAQLGQQLAGLRDVKPVYLEDLRQSFSLLDKLWLLLVAQWVPRFVTRKMEIHEPAVVLFTSGSEGKPKGVVLSHQAILSNVAQIKAVIDFSPADKIMSVLPIFHAFGLTVGAILPMVTGTKVYLYPSPLHYRVIPEVIYDKGCTVLVGTGTFLGQYARHADPYDFFRLRYVVAGAERLSEEVRKLWSEKFGIRILEGYGATECAPVLSVNTPFAFKPGSVGKLLPGIEAKIEPVGGIPTGGQLHVKGPNLMSGYYLYEAPGVLKPPSSSLGEGWYATGDIVEMDEEGFLILHGRMKRFAKVAGEMVSLEVVEQLALQASPEFQHAATNPPDPQRGESIVLFTTDPALIKEALLATSRNLGYPELFLPRRIVHVETLPLLGTGKTDYVTLKRMAEAE